MIEFNQLAMANSSGSDDMLNRVMPRDNIGLAALLKTNETAWENCESFLSLFIILSVGSIIVISMFAREKNVSRFRILRVKLN